MAKISKPHRYREDLSEMPDWLKKKKCPERTRYLSGQRILPKNLTGREELPDVIDKAFLAYNGARLREACQLFTEKMLGPKVTVGMSLSGGADPRRPWLLLDCPANPGGFRRLDRLHRRHPLSRPAFRAQLSGSRRQLQNG